MQINFLGDSITEGAGASSHEKMYTAIVCSRLGAKENNFGKGGTRIAPQIHKAGDPFGENFILRAKTMPKDADFTFVMGGTNDYGHGDAPLGAVDDAARDTFCAAFADLARYMRDNFGKEKVCFLLPLPRYDQDNPYGDGSKKRPQEPLSAYIAAEKAILEKFELPYLDLSDAFPVPERADSTAFTIDGLHPNDKGHSLIAERLVAYLEKLFFPAETPEPLDKSGI